MPRYTRRSQGKLDTCHPSLIGIFAEVIKQWDCTIVWGERGEAEQTEYHETGRSQLPYPRSKHNKSPSLAVDVMPCQPDGRINWQDRELATYFAGYVMRVAHEMGVNLRWGGDWDQDYNLRDNGFDDLAHYEIVTD